MAAEASLIEMAKSTSRESGPVALVMLAHDCPDSRAFQETLDRVVPSFGDGLKVISSTGSHRNRDGNPVEIKQALESFAYDKNPCDLGGNQRGHFPCGAIYANGEEVARLPSDTLLASMSEKTLADFIQDKTGAEYNLKELTARSDRPHT